MEKRDASTRYEPVEWINPRNGKVQHTFRVTFPQIELGNAEPGEDIHGSDTAPLPFITRSKDKQPE